MLYDCANCHKKVSFVFRDKVNNKLVCFECMSFAIENSVRISSDFEKVK